MVCKENNHKYKCPRCRTLYCSVKCYKAHECTSESTATRTTTTSTTRTTGTTAAASTTQPGSQNVVNSLTSLQQQQQLAPLEDIFPGLVKAHHIAAMKGDPKLMNYLSDSRLQTLMTNIDAADNREKALARALDNDADFKSIMLRIVEHCQQQQVDVLDR